MRIAIAQIAPVLLDRAATTTKVVDAINDAATGGAKLVCFGEALIPAYPVWVSRTDGARFNDPEQNALQAMYIDQAVSIEQGDLNPVRDACRERAVSVVLGIIERPIEKSGHSLTCSRVIIDGAGEILSVHRKLMPTHEERLCWAQGDGHGLVTHPLGPFTLGALNCWENWLPLARTALYAQGENLHVALWPGSTANTTDITRFIAMESRAYVVSACGLITPDSIPSSVPLRDTMTSDPDDPWHNGGSAIANPDGTWLIEPVADKETILHAELDFTKVLEARALLDVTGHYSRPDVLKLHVNRERQQSAHFED